jgi:hypothetical protein
MAALSRALRMGVADELGHEIAGAVFEVTAPWRDYMTGGGIGASDLAALGIRSIGLDPLGSVHGRLAIDKFRTILVEHLAAHSPRMPERIWVRLPLP